MHEVTTDDGQRVKLIEEQDLETWLDAQLGRLLRWGLILFVGVIGTVAASWMTVQTRMSNLERDLTTIRTEGTPTMRSLASKVDSLSLRMQYELPRLIADEVERRTREAR